MLMPRTQFYVIGDSHTRSFSENPLFLPIFLGPGKEFCFVTEEKTKNVFVGLQSLLRKSGGGEKVILCFGEPDTRYFLNKGWQPWLDSGEESIDLIDEKVESSFQRYVAVIKSLREEFKVEIFVLCVLPSIRRSQNHFSKVFNSLLRHHLECTQSATFIDIEEDLLSDSFCLKADLSADPVHCTPELADIVATKLINLGKLSSERHDSENELYSKPSPLLDLCEYNKRFNCFKPKKSRKLFFRIIRKMQFINWKSG